MARDMFVNTNTIYATRTIYTIGVRYAPTARDEKKGMKKGLHEEVLIH